MNILMYNLKLDEKDTVLGFTSDWVQEFAKNVDNLYLITMSTGAFEVPKNVKVFSIGHEKGYSKIRLLFNFYAQLFHVLKNYKINGCFSHMQPLFTALSGWVLRLMGIKVVTWYAHPSITKALKIAHLFSNNMVASVYQAYPYKKNKLKVIGQAIDTQVFRPAENAMATSKNTILYVGRLAPVKNIETLIEAAAILKTKTNLPFKVKIVGDPKKNDQSNYKETLISLAQSLDVAEKIHFESGVPRSALVPFYQQATVFVNLTPIGSGDKVVWEAMACELPTICANPGFEKTMGSQAEKLLFEYGNPSDLSNKLQALLDSSALEKKQISTYLRQQVLDMHPLNKLPNKVIQLLD